jgi:hypothetical protein
VSEHVELWKKIRLAAMVVDLSNDRKFELIKQWARAFLEEKGDYAIAIAGKGYVTISQLAEDPSRYPEFVEILFKIAGAR